MNPALPSFAQSFVFLPLVFPIALWVAWSDMKSMRIPNVAVLALLAVFVLAAPWVMPWATVARALGLGFGVLACGFVANAARLVGAGDAKFAAAMAPFFVGSDLRMVMALFAGCLLGAYATHRLARAIGPLRRQTPDWASWAHKDFPMGLALSGTILFYLTLPFLNRAQVFP